MIIKILKEEKDKIEFEIIGEDHTLCNLIRQELWKDKDTKVVMYNIKHSQASNPIFSLESEEKPRKALSKAVERIKKQLKELRPQVKNLKVS